jgi:hypothetical protein
MTTDLIPTVMKRFFGNTFILTGFVYATWALFGGGIDYYPRLDRLQENFVMEFLNISSNLIVMGTFLLWGFIMLLRSR